MATYPKMSLPQLRTASRQRADMVYSQFVSEAELNSYINASYFKKIFAFRKILHMQSLSRYKW